MQRIFAGDVQGCADELEELEQRARASFGGDFELWLVGDLVNRGPYSLRVLRRVREWMEAGRARCVLGNHDLGLLRVAAGQAAPGPRDTIGEVLAAPDAGEWIEWLRRLPLVAGGRLGRQPFAVVHAASHPDWSLDELVGRAREVEARLADPDRREWTRLLGGEADPELEPLRQALARLTRCRSACEDGAWSEQPPGVAPPGYEPWHAVWSRRDHHHGLVYGHWATQGLHVARGLRGLDTGCVHYGRGRAGLLTAWLPPPDAETPFDVPDDRFWHVPARRVYYGA